MGNSKINMEVVNINVHDKVVSNKQTFSKLDYALIYASEIFLYQDVISLTIK